jgi:hypothetical protein
MANLLRIAFALLACGFSHPAFAQTLAAQPRGVYATIDMRATQDLVRRLNGTAQVERNPAMREVLKDPSAYMPPVLYALANALAADPRRGAEAVFWYHVGRLRAVYDALRCRDKSVLNMVNVLGKTLTVELRALMFYDRSGLVGIATRAIDWDSNNPRNYDQRWINLYGDVAATSPGTDPAALSVPESEWPAILKSVHDTHLQAVTAFAAEKKGQ